MQRRKGWIRARIRFGAASDRSGGDDRARVLKTDSGGSHTNGVG